MAENIPQLTPRNLTEALDFCDRLAKTAFVPDAYRNKPGEILAAIQYGAELGIGPMQALQGIAVINGRPSLWGDVMLALVQASGLLEYINETSTADSATCEVKRKGDKHVCKETFTQAMAMKAGLAQKQGPWQQYPQRMRQMRARGFALRNKFADVLKGVIAREEAMDYPATDTTAVQLPPDDLANEHAGSTPADGAGPSSSHPVGAKAVLDPSASNYSAPKLSLVPETPVAAGKATPNAEPVPPATIKGTEHETALRTIIETTGAKSGKVTKFLDKHFGVEELEDLPFDKAIECGELMEKEFAI